MSGVRPIFVVDGDGELVGAFTDWMTGHEWAHARAAEPGARLPVRVEDPRFRRTTEIDGSGCWLTRWRVMSRQELCGPTRRSDAKRKVRDKYGTIFRRARRPGPQ